MSSIESAGPRFAQRRLVAVIAGGVVALDAVTKAIAVRALAGRGVVNLLGGHFHLELYRNFAGPGNILRGHTLLVSLLSLLAVTMIAVAAWSVRTTSYAVAAGLLLGGGVGNLLDRLLRAPGPLRGGVVDWIKPTLSGAASTSPISRSTRPSSRCSSVWPSTGIATVASTPTGMPSRRSGSRGNGSGEGGPSADPACRRPRPGR
jgi:lipoprotein signal peptidase